MKKALSLILVAITLFSMFSLVSCGKMAVEGTYKFDHSNFTDSNISEEKKSYVELAANQLFKDKIIKLEDGKYYLGKSDDSLAGGSEYLYDSGKVSLGGEIYTYKKGTLIYEFNYDDEIILELVYTKQK